MILTDVHTHTKFSADGRDDIFSMVRRAKELGITYYGISEHFDYDYKVNDLSFDGTTPVFTDAEAYFTTARAVQKEEAKNGFHLLVGGEFGFTPNKKVLPLYRELVEKYSPDFVVNSVHTNALSDYCYDDAFKGKNGEEIFAEYCDLVLKSVYADYRYDIISHFGYVTRYAPYEDVKFCYERYHREIDAILKGIVERQTILEVNSSTYGTGKPFLPDFDILKRYFELGGKKVSFASDAHFTSRVMDKRETVVSALKEIGFEYITVPDRGEHIQVKI